ncbi:FAD-binding protein [Methylobrevis pamukkalensis]|uniref:3-oxosteroid 1-dehydrogenase n=1 Tax=Methylobrevis pamukkalensis TaxID=1439726 RepID=A0A1E3H4I5_9HYPH|nr:FAD-binding protein [Methylobrevis pamukkalensis]ODN71224.1 3-oxosteroid 1-dehydrogenase [Methylobrevis pamukkalensis]
MLAFVESATPLKFRLTDEPDPMAERPGGKAKGRMVSPEPISRRLLGPLARKLRRSTLPHIFSYQEMLSADPYHTPIRAGLKLWPKLAWRLLTGIRGQGNALMTGLLKGCLDAGCRIETGARGLELVADEAGGVTGVVFQQGARRRRVAASRGVVLAAGGFDWNEAMRAAHFPGPFDRIGGPAGNEGDAHVMAEAAGAALTRMDQANVFPCLPTRYEGRRHGLPMVFQGEPHSILVGRHGRRFVSECDYNVGEELDRRDPETGEGIHLPAWVIADSRFPKTSLMFRWYARYEPDWIVRGHTIADLAGRIGLPAAELEASVARFNGFCAKGHDADFQRGESKWEAKKFGGTAVQLKPIEVGPFLALTFNRSIIGTKGGVATNEKGQALRPDGSVVAGLYAAGLTMANPIGTRALGAGTTIGPNLTWGFIAAETLLKDNR